MNNNKIKVIIVTGPTATGKTSLAINLARKFNGEIVSADSRQVYKGLDLGTGKDLDEYRCGGKPVRYHLIDIAEPNTVYNLKQFNIDAKQKFNDINKRGKLPILAGGTVSYIDSLLSDYKFPIPPPDKKLREEIEKLSTKELVERIKKFSPQIYDSIDNKNSRPRVIRHYETIFSKYHSLNNSEPVINNYEWLILGTYFPRKEVHERINLRLQSRIKAGMIEEVKKLHENGLSWDRLDSFGLEYRYISKYLKNEISYEVMYNSLLAKIRRLARSQDIWFRKLENKNYNIYWLTENKPATAAMLVLKFLKSFTLPEPELKIKDIFYGPRSN
ncbi:MAG: tRNA (adenosine(37)-N6)-dimethylallyltransferase MiaA [Victivallales bacterium]|nr:tRNA (adenosine(37)-N6)-dimethylallyltransferase MiaA [Victivallales bacterium]